MPAPLIPGFSQSFRDLVILQLDGYIYINPSTVIQFLI